MILLLNTEATTCSRVRAARLLCHDASHYVRLVADAAMHQSSKCARYVSNTSIASCYWLTIGISHANT